MTNNIQHLSNETVRNLLVNLSREEAVRFRAIMEQTFEDISAGDERRYQPETGTTLRPNGQRALFRGFTSDSSVGAKIIVEPPFGPDGKRDPIKGVLVLLDGQGVPTALLAAEELTGYRTSMNAMVPFSWRDKVDKIVIFGAGVQALWHTRLILTLRGSEVKTITYATPRKQRFDELVATVSEENASRWKSACSFHFLSVAEPDSSRQIEKLLVDADCVFCTTSSREPLFPAHFLTSRRSGGGRQPFVSAVGSWQPDIVELDPALLQHAVDAKDGYHPTKADAGGVVLVDDREHALTQSGEIFQGNIAAENLVELGEVIALRKGTQKPVHDTHLADLERFISRGFVVYKSIGVSLTDLTISNAILSLATR